MKIGFIIPTYPNERRVALLPEHINDFENEIVMQYGFGETLDIDDDLYVQKGCKMMSREEIFRTTDVIFCLKLLQPADYPLLRDNQTIVGWTHPTGSGKEFYDNIAIKKNLKIVDLDNICPTVRQGERIAKIDTIK
ncbi:MAG: N(5)-(carboxyethyl)ornithine synthase, partial [Bacteroidales bacterium]|nr:N(5)-(carboxyethyl)ornithine synthase [Bacteroidales bacterium]